MATKPRSVEPMVPPPLGNAPLARQNTPLLNPLLMYPPSDAERAAEPKPEEIISEKVGVAVESTATTSSSSPAEGIQLALDDIGPNPYNSRAIYLPEDIDLLRVSLLEHGQLEAIKVRKNPDEKGPPYLLVNGETRWMAAKSSNGRIPSLWAVVTNEQNPKKLYAESYATNTDRKQNSDLDKALSWSKMLADGVFETQEDLAAWLKLALSTVNAYLQIAALPDALLTRLKACHHFIKISHALEIARAYESLGPDAASQLIEAMAQGTQQENRISVRELQKEVKRLLAQKTEKRVAVRTLPPLKLMLPSGELAGELLTNRTGELKLKVKLPDITEQNKFAQEVKSLLTKYGIS